MRRLQPAASAARNSASKPLSNSAINTRARSSGILNASPYQLPTIFFAHGRRTGSSTVGRQPPSTVFSADPFLFNLRLFFRFQSLNPFLVWVYDRRRMFESLVPFVVIIVLVLVILWLIDQA